MDIEIVGLIVSILGVGSFAALFTILYMTYSNSLINEYKSGKRDIELIDEAIYENLSKTKKRKKIIRTIKSVGFYGLMIIIVPFFVMAMVSKFNGSIPMINGKGIIVVASGSMSEKHEENLYLVTQGLDDQFPTYSMIVVEKVDSDSDLKKWDIISFVDDTGKNTIHRIVKIDYAPDGSAIYTTRGDSNNTDDKYKPVLEDIQGRYTGKYISTIGMFILFMQSSIGIITVVSLVYCLFVIDRLTNKMTKAEEERLEILSSVIDISEETEQGKLKTKFIEKIYYKGISYTFNETGFIEKNEITDPQYLEQSNTSIIRVVETDGDSEVVTQEVVQTPSGKEDE